LALFVGKLAHTKHIINNSDLAGYICVGIIISSIITYPGGSDLLRVIRVHPHAFVSRSAFSGLRGGMDMAFGSIHLSISDGGVLQLPDPITSGPVAATSSLTATSYAS
jgi:hypothetical protein